MQAPKKPTTEAERLEALRSYQLLDTAGEIAYDDIAKLAAYICETPIALVTLVDDTRQWFKSQVGIDASITETARDISFCGHVVYEGKPLVIGDTLKDERFHDNPFVTGDLGVRFYAGEPLKDDEGHTLGSLCVVDSMPRELTAKQSDALNALARQVMAQFKARREMIKQAKLAADLAASQRLMKRFFSREDVWMGIVELENENTIRQLYNNPITHDFLVHLGVDPHVLYFGDKRVPGLDLWFKAYRDCARTESTQAFDTQSVLVEPPQTQRATCHYIGLSERGFPQMSFTVEDVTKLRADEKLLEEQRRLVVTSSKLSSLGEMAAGMAHEINNPLAIIGGRAQEMRMLIERGSPPDKILHAIQSIEKTVTRISKIIKGLRSFARESSRDPMVPVKVIEVLNETLAFCSARFAAHGVGIDIAPINGELEIKCRSAEMSQVFLNLLNNAYDAIERLPGERWVRVQFEQVDQGLEIWVTDSGKGIAPEIREKIMEPFFTTKAVDRGTGLGLSITRGIIEAHGGKFLLDESCANTRFVIRLPLAQARHVA